MSDQFSYLASRHDLPKEPTVAEMKQELEYLRAFYLAWEHLHSLSGDKRSSEFKKKAEDAAQDLVDAAVPLRRMRNGN